MTLYKTPVSHKTSQNSKNASREQHPSSTTVTGKRRIWKTGTGKQQSQNLDSSLDIGFKNSVEPQELIIAGHGVRRAPLLVEVILLILLAQHIYSSENVDHTHDADNLLLLLLLLFLFTVLFSSPYRLLFFFFFFSFFAARLLRCVAGSGFGATKTGSLGREGGIPPASLHSPTFSGRKAAWPVFLGTVTC
jgi:hypothetical protein